MGNPPKPSPSKKSAIEPTANPIINEKVVNQHNLISCEFCNGLFKSQTIRNKHTTESHFSSMMLDMSFNTGKYIDRDEGGGVSLYASSE